MTYITKKQVRGSEINYWQHISIELYISLESSEDDDAITVHHRGLKVSFSFFVTVII